MHLPNPSRRQFLRQLSAAGLTASLFPSGIARCTAALPLLQSQTVDNAKLASGTRGAAATVHPEASRAAIRALERGGNAMDAAVAASLMLSVVDGHNSGLGGGCLIVLRTADGTVQAIDGREMAPGKSTPEMFFRNGQPDPMLSRIGPLAAGVPGLVSALDRLSREYGRLNWDTALEHAADVAEDGFELTNSYAGVLARAADDLRKFPESARVLLDPNGQAWQAGDRLRQPDLARTLRKIAEQGSEWFYEGEFARRTEDLMHETGGLLSETDFANYRSLQRPPVQCGYRDKQVLGCPPPSSGGIHIAQMLSMLEPYDVAEIFNDSPATGLHLLLEVMKRAMADRAYWLGDADFAKVPKGLLDKDYLQSRAAAIDLGQATEVSSHGQPPRADLDLFGRQRHTTHVATADSEGNVVAITQTVNTSFGCKMVVPGTGVALNNEMDDFSIAPGVRNVFGLLGSEANVVAPGKRPLSSMSPTIVLDDKGHPLLTCGAAGGPKIITATLQVIVRVLDLQQSIGDAIAAPRVHHQWSPNEAVCEQAWDDSLIQQLSDFGHRIKRIRSSAVAQGIHFDADELNAASDPRVPSSAMGL